MCWGPICTVVEVWCCSEHNLWLFDGSLECSVLLLCNLFLRLLKLRKLAVCKLDLSRGGLTWCQGLLDHGLNLHWNIPLTCWCALWETKFCQEDNNIWLGNRLWSNIKTYLILFQWRGTVSVFKCVEVQVYIFFCVHYYFVLNCNLKSQTHTQQW